MKKSLFFVLSFALISFTNIFAQNVPTLISPKNGEEINSLFGIICWEKNESHTTCRLQIASDTTFDNIVEDVITDIPGFVLKNKLGYKRTYFWRIAFFTPLSELKWSETRSFILGTWDINSTKKKVRDFWKKAIKG